MPTIPPTRPRSAPVSPSNRPLSSAHTFIYFAYTTVSHPAQPTPPSRLPPWRRDEPSISTTSVPITAASTSSPIAQPSTTFAAQIAGVPSSSSSSSNLGSKPAAIVLCVVFGVLILAGIGGVVYLKRRIHLRASRASRVPHGSDNLTREWRRHRPSAPRNFNDPSCLTESGCGLDTVVAVEDEPHTGAYTEPKFPASSMAPALPQAAIIRERDPEKC